jgi:hypothetical protein
LVSFGVVDEVAEDFFATGECIFHESLTVDKQNEVMRILPDFTTPALRGVKHGVFTWVVASPFDFCGCHFFVGFAFGVIVPECGSYLFLCRHGDSDMIVQGSNLLGLGLEHCIQF